MRLRTLTLAFLVAGAFLPAYAYAQENSFFGPIIPQSGACTCPGSAPDWGCILKVVQNVINAGVGIAIVIIVLALAYAGFVFMTRGTNPSARTQGRNVVLNSLIGLAIILGAWLLVDFVMKAVYNPDAVYTGDLRLGPWNSIWAPSDGDMCIRQTEQIALTTGRVEISLGAPVGTTPSGSGSCTVPANANNPCSVQSLSSTCFVQSGVYASQVCMKESLGGQTAILSGSDKLNSGRGPSYSVGLWQINLTTSPLRANGRSCRDAFSEPCQGAAIRNQGRIGWCRARIVDQGLYDACVRAAQNPQINTQVACSLYNTRMSAWMCSASRCGVPGARVMSGVCAPGN